MKPFKKRYPKPILKSERITLKRYELNFAQEMFDQVVIERKRLARFLPWAKYMKTVADEKKYIRGALKAWKEHKQFAYSILGKDGQFMGNIDAHAVRWDSHDCEIGYWIASEFEGKGYVSEAVRTLERELFKIGFNRIGIRCHTKNKRSARVMISCGYKHEATLRQYGVNDEGFYDVLIFGKLKSDRKNRLKSQG